MEEKKPAKITLGTFVCIIIILILIVAVAILWINWQNEKDNLLKQISQNIETSKNIIENSAISNTINSSINNVSENKTVANNIIENTVTKTEVKTENKNENNSSNDSSLVGTWNTKYYQTNEKDEMDNNLRNIFGTSAQYGSYLKILDNNKFEDHVYPMTEGDKHRKGTYSVDNNNNLVLKYDDDPSYTVNVFVMNNSILVYKDNNNMFFLSK